MGEAQNEFKKRLAERDESRFCQFRELYDQKSFTDFSRAYGHMGANFPTQMLA